MQKLENKEKFEGYTKSNLKYIHVAKKIYPEI